MFSPKGVPVLPSQEEGIILSGKSLAIQVKNLSLAIQVKNLKIYRSSMAIPKDNITAWLYTI